MAKKVYPVRDQQGGFTPDDGMDLRDYFAGQAIIGVAIAQAHARQRGDRFLDTKQTCELVWRLADAIVECRSQ
jgi:hypothetical protein